MAGYFLYVRESHQNDAFPLWIHGVALVLVFFPDTHRSFSTVSRDAQLQACRREGSWPPLLVSLRAFFSFSRESQNHLPVTFLRASEKDVHFHISDLCKRGPKPDSPFPAAGVTASQLLARWGWLCSSAAPPGRRPPSRLPCDFAKSLL